MKHNCWPPPAYQFYLPQRVLVIINHSTLLLLQVLLINSLFIWMVQEPDIAAVSVPDPSANVVAAEPSVATQKETAQPKPVANQPLSPYTV